MILLKDLMKIIDENEDIILTNTIYYPDDNEIYFVGSNYEIPAKFNNWKVIKIGYFEREMFITINKNNE